MNALESWLGDGARAVWAFLWPQHEKAQHDFLTFVANAATSVFRSYVWFLLIGIALYFLFIRKRGDGFSLWRGLKHLLPASIYTHASFKLDLMWLPFSWVINFLVFAGLSVGAAAVQVWLVARLGHSPLTVPAGALAVTLQIVFTLIGTDFARFLWHYQGHKVPFFWEFHKGHHSAEVLHPVFIRTHPVDMFVRLAYMGVGGGLFGGALMYLAGVDASPVGASLLAVIGTIIAHLQEFEHSHVKLSFGKTLDRFLYAPHFHQIHHSALLEHRDKNLGLTGGLLLWDRLFGTLYVPKPDERVVFGATLEELGENNPHRTLWSFLKGPFVAAVQTLRPLPGRRTDKHPLAASAARAAAAR